jgi:hypothetical protein
MVLFRLKDGQVHFSYLGWQGLSTLKYKLVTDENATGPKTFPVFEQLIKYALWVHINHLLNDKFCYFFLYVLL